MNSPLYVIRDWSKHFETSESKKRVQALSWVAVPTKHDGLTFRRLMAHDPTGAIFGVWALILQVAAKCAVRGTLADKDGRPLTFEDISLKTGLNIDSIARAVEFLSSSEMRWIEDSHKSIPTEYKEHNNTIQRAGAAAGSGRSTQDVVSQLVDRCFSNLPEQQQAPADRRLTPEETAFIIRTNGGTFLTPPSSEFKSWWDALPPGLKSGEDECWLYWPTAIGKLMNKHPLDWSGAVMHLVRKTKQFAQSPKGKSNEYRWSPMTFLEGGHCDDDPSAWEKSSGVEKKKRTPKVSEISR